VPLVTCRGAGRAALPDDAVLPDDRALIGRKVDASASARRAA
jgi:hypothetical protein